MNKLNKVNVVLGIAVATLINYTIYVESNNSRLRHLVELSDARSGINQEWADEITHIMLNKLSEENEDGLRSQGRMEGIVEYLTNPKKWLRWKRESCSLPISLCRLSPMLSKSLTSIRKSKRLKILVESRVDI